MVLERVRGLRARLAADLHAAFSEDLPPRDVAGSFAIGLFLAALPNFGLSLLVIGALAYRVERTSTLALLAAIVVMNPPAKWAVYAASYWLGRRLLGPATGPTVEVGPLPLGPDALLRLLVGNLIVAAVIAVVGYLLALRTIRTLRRRDVHVLEHLPIADPDDGS